MRIPHTLARGLLLIAAATLFSQPVSGVSQDVFCNEDERELRRELRVEAGQKVAAWAINERGNLVWFVVNPEDGTWTVIVAFRDRAGCRVNSGTDWHWLSDEGGQR